MNCKLIVVVQYRYLNAIRLRANMTFLYRIEPAIKPAATNSNTKDWHSSHTGTLIKHFKGNQTQQFKNTKIIDQVGHGLVPLIEKRENVFVRNDRITSLYLHSVERISIIW
jgi:glutamate racemase